jgi:hypothetical protein
MFANLFYEKKQKHSTHTDPIQSHASMKKKLKVKNRAISSVKTQLHIIIIRTP